MEKEQINSPLQTVSRSNFQKKKIIIISVLVILFIITLVFLVKNKSLSSKLRPLTNNLQQIIPTPTLYPNQEITIPYLRKRTYKSAIDENKTVAFQGANYTAYIASYDSDGSKINGLLTEPTGEMPEGGWPAILFLHGYIPPTVYETNGTPYRAYVDYLARNGFVVYKIDLRGHADSEGTARGGYFTADYVIDALNGYAALQNANFVNPKKIGLWGHSMAGNITLRSLAVKPTIPVAVIWAGAVYSYTDRDTYGINDLTYRPPADVTRAQNTRNRLGNYDPNNIFWQEFVPTNYLNDLKGAIQINHAVDDTVVNVGYSRDLMKLLDKTTVPHELYEFPTGGHNISGVSFDEAMQNTIEFYKKYLSK